MTTLSTIFHYLDFVADFSKEDWCGPMHGYWGMGGFGMVFTFLIWAALLGLLAWAIFSFTRGKRFGRNQDKDTPLEVLKRRYASGEIDEGEFKKMKKTLLEE